MDAGHSSIPYHGNGEHFERTHTWSVPSSGEIITRGRAEGCAYIANEGETRAPTKQSTADTFLAGLTVDTEGDRSRIPQIDCGCCCCFIMLKLGIASRRMRIEGPRSNELWSLEENPCVPAMFHC